MAGGAKTPGRLKAGGQEEGSAAAATAAARAAKADATVDIGALLRNKRSGLLGTSGGFGSLAGSRPAAPAGAAPGTLGASFAGGRGLDVITAENPIYSPDDSLARAASKLQNLKAPQVRAPSRASQAQAAIAAAAVLPAAAAAPQADASPEPAPERCESPQLIPAFAAAAAGEAPAPAGEGSHKALSGEDSGELAALSALQKRRKSLGPATAAKQRFGEWFEGTDKELENTLQEYNREAPAPSPRMTRAQRRKSLAVDQSLHLEPGLARSLLDRSLAAEEAEEREGGAGRGQVQQQQEAQEAVAGQTQQQKRGAAGRRKSLAAMQQVQVALPAERPAQHAHRASVADEVAALNAEMCAALTGLVGDESPEKAGHRGDQRPLREKLLESWDGKTYYERLLAMQEAEQEQQRFDRQQAAGGARQQQKGAAGAQAGKPAARTPGAKVAAAARAPAAAAAQPATQPAAVAEAAAAGQPAAAARTAPSPLQVALAGSSAVAAAKAALMTPNSQRRKLNELTESLQLLKVSTRQSRAAAAIQAAQQQRGATPAPDGEETAAHPAVPPAAASRALGGSRSVSPEPPGPAASDRGSAEPAAAPKTAGKRGGRRATSPLTEASAALAPAAPAAVLPQASAAPAGQASGSQVELGVVQERLGAALAEKESLVEQLRQVQAELGAERAARAAEQQELEQLRAKRKEDAAALKASEQRAKQLARELQEAQAAAAAHAKCAAEVEARWADAEKALGAVLKAANGGLKAAAAGKEEVKSLGEALRSCAGAGENAPAAPAASSGRSRQSTGRQWR